MHNAKLNKLLSQVKFVLLPIAFALYPVVFFYGKNLGVARITSAGRIALWYILVAVISYCLLFLAANRQPAKAAVTSVIALLFLLYYGLIIAELRKLNLVRAEHFPLMPLLVFFTFCLIWIIIRQTEKFSLRLWRIATSAILVLLLVNLLPILYIILKAQFAQGWNSSIELSSNPQLSAPAESGKPDIYFIIFDEMAGFEVVRRYWDFNEVEQFVDYLVENDFYVAEDSHANSFSTMNQMASRLNYEIFPHTSGSRGYEYLVEQRAITNNKVIAYLKAQGYTTVVFSELNSGFLFAAMPSVQADLVYEEAKGIQIESTKSNTLDEFSLFVLKSTALTPWLAELDARLPLVEQHRQMVSFTIETAPIVEAASPKFVYIHLALPHMPFLFDQHGELLDPKDYYNWDMYLGQYAHSLFLAKTLIGSILATSNGARTPVIIFQSDHGARNSDGTTQLENYPEEYKTWIVNALLLPDCENAPLTQDMDPINTFPIVFNCYFDANIPLK